MDKNKPRKSAVWDEVQTLSHPESGLGVVIKERVRGRSSWSWHLIYTGKDGSVEKFIPGHLPAIGDLKTEDGAPVQMEDIVFSLVKAARENIDARFKDAKEKTDGGKKRDGEKRDGEKTSKKPKRDKDRRGGDDRKERKPQGGLSTLAKKDAQEGGHDYKSPTARKKEKRAQAKANAQG